MARRDGVSAVANRVARLRRDGVSAAALLLGVGACAAPCPPGYAPATVAVAYFGGDVANPAWVAFLGELVTPAFPDGLTVQPGQGQWRGREGVTQQEASRVLTLVLPRARPDQAAARLAPVTAAYRARFAQESVLVTLGAGCAAF